MSYLIVKEVREALRTGRVKLTGKGKSLDVAVLLLIADDCRDATRRASLGQAELTDLTGAHRSSLTRSTARLVDVGCIRVVSLGRRVGTKGQATVFEIPRGFPVPREAP